ncbi:hypothetical protein D3C85_972920 [compost metagenome]
MGDHREYFSPLGDGRFFLATGRTKCIGAQTRLALRRISARFQICDRLLRDIDAYSADPDDFFIRSENGKPKHPKHARRLVEVHPDQTRALPPGNQHILVQGAPLRIDIRRRDGITQGMAGAGCRDLQKRCVDMGVPATQISHVHDDRCAFAKCFQRAFTHAQQTLDSQIQDRKGHNQHDGQRRESGHHVSCKMIRGQRKLLVLLGTKHKPADTTGAPDGIHLAPERIGVRHQLGGTPIANGASRYIYRPPRDDNLHAGPVRTIDGFDLGLDGGQPRQQLSRHRPLGRPMQKKKRSRGSTQNQRDQNCCSQANTPEAFQSHRAHNYQPLSHAKIMTNSRSAAHSIKIMVNSPNCRGRFLI